MGALNASGHIRRPKPARSSRRARLLIAGLVVAVWTIVVIQTLLGASSYLRELCKRQGLLTDKPVTGPACNLQRPWEAP